MTDGTIRLVDRSTGKAQELGISDLDIEVNDLRAGKPLEVKLEAAVLAQKQNLVRDAARRAAADHAGADARAADAEGGARRPGAARPVPPEGRGAPGGDADADWKADLGGAVPGGKGPTKAKGGIHVRGVRFAGTSAAPVDLTVDTDLDGNAETGDLDIRTLAIALGQAGITGHGRVKALASEKPSIENFEIVGHDLDPAVIARSFPAVAKALKGRPPGRSACPSAAPARRPRPRWTSCSTSPRCGWRFPSS